MKRRILIRNAHASQLLESFFISAITSILLIRVFLAITHYPQLGGNGLHIAHMLWGGLLMLSGTILLLSYLGQRVMTIASVLAGIGFGAFIDELGKFITSDNNYFFKPSIAIIYVLFVGLYFVFQAITTKRGLTQEEYLVNAFFRAEEVAQRDLDSAEKTELLRYLKHSNQDDPLVAALQESLELMRTKKPRKPTVYGRTRHALLNRYRTLATKSWFVRAITFLFIAQALISVAFVADSLQDQSSIANVSFVSSLVSAVLILIGVLYIRSSKAQAYTWFRRALIFDILVTQVFLFYHDQFGAARGLALKLVLLIGLQFIIDHQASLKE